MAIEIATHLKYAKLQIASEAFMALRTDSLGTTSSGLLDAGLLKKGNNCTSRFTALDAEWFSQDWEVVEHISNTATGFSGTLFRAPQDHLERGIVEGEQVICFHGTKFVDEAVRGNLAANVMEIKAEDWALGQISDMRVWVDALHATGKISVSALLTATGYGLGGHLATAFNVWYPSAACATYVDFHLEVTHLAV